MEVNSPLQLVPPKRWLGCPARPRKVPFLAFATQRPSVRGRSFPQGAEVLTACERFKLREGTVLCGFWESRWSNKLMLWLLFKRMPGKGPGYWEMAALPEQ